MTPCFAFGLPSQDRFAPVSGTLVEVQPSKATVRYRPIRTPGVLGCAAGPASTSNNACIGAGPRRRRRLRSAVADGGADPAARARVSFFHTFWYPSSG